MLGSAKPDWARDGQDWPNRETSRFLRAGGLDWHVQEAGQGPGLLLLHGTGAASHSWRDLILPLSRHFRVVAPDLPGHGFTATPAMNGLSLPGMARLVTDLLEEIELSPALVAGHSAGAAILCRMCIDATIAPRAVVSFNGAFLPFKGLAGQVFPPLARFLTFNPLVPRFFAWGAVADPVSVERLITGTGSRLDERGLALYRRLIRSTGHVSAALRMMASWDLAPLVADLPRLRQPLILAVGSEDRAVAPGDAEAVLACAPHARIERLAGLGHLAHEEDPARAARLIAEVAAEAGLLGPSGRDTAAAAAAIAV